VQICLAAGACVVLRRYGNIYELCARSSAGSERLATNQKVGSSNLSGRTCGIQQAKTHPLKIAKDAAPPFVAARYLGCLNPVGAFHQSLEIENVTVRHPPINKLLGK
jgi:hypothetical protein